MSSKTAPNENGEVNQDPCLKSSQQIPLAPVLPLLPKHFWDLWVHGWLYAFQCLGDSEPCWVLMFIVEMPLGCVRGLQEHGDICTTQSPTQSHRKWSYPMWCVVLSLGEPCCAVSAYPSRKMRNHAISSHGIRSKTKGNVNRFEDFATSAGCRCLQHSHPNLTFFVAARSWKVLCNWTNDEGTLTSRWHAPYCCCFYCFRTRTCCCGPIEACIWGFNGPGEGIKLKKRCHLEWSKRQFQAKCKAFVSIGRNVLRISSQINS